MSKDVEMVRCCFQVVHACGKTFHGARGACCSGVVVPPLFVVCLFGSCGCVSREAGRLAVVFGGVVIVKGEFRDVGCGRQNGEFKGLICCRKQMGLQTDLWRQQDWQW